MLFETLSGTSLSLLPIEILLCILEKLTLEELVEIGATAGDLLFISKHPEIPSVEQTISKLLQNETPWFITNPHILEYKLLKQKEQVLSTLSTITSQFDDYRVLDAMIHANRPDLLELCVKYIPQIFAQRNRMVDLAIEQKSGCLDVLLSIPEIYMDSRTLDSACKQLDVEIVDAVLKRIENACLVGALNSAICAGNYKVVEFLVENCECKDAEDEYLVEALMACYRDIQRFLE